MEIIKLEYTKEIVVAGLSVEQAAIYETLLKIGTSPASHIMRALPLGSTLSRPLVYKILSEICSLGLVQKQEVEGKVSLFTAEHPIKLKEILSRRKEEIEAATTLLDGAIGKLNSVYNLLSGKPGVQFFEGMGGIRAVLRDALTSEEEIYSYVDIDVVEKEIPAISREFAEDRRKLGLKKKNIGIDSHENRQHINGYYTDITEERLIPWPTNTFGTVMQIYDGKVSYMTLTEPKIGIIIADPHIYTMHRSLFEFTWNHPAAYIPAKK